MSGAGSRKGSGDLVFPGPSPFSANSWEEPPTMPSKLHEPAPLAPRDSPGLGCLLDGQTLRGSSFQELRLESNVLGLGRSRDGVCPGTLSHV